MAQIRVTCTVPEAVNKYVRKYVEDRCISLATLVSQLLISFEEQKTSLAIVSPSAKEVANLTTSKSKPVKKPPPPPMRLPSFNPDLTDRYHSASFRLHPQSPLSQTLLAAGRKSDIPAINTEGHGYWAKGNAVMGQGFARGLWDTIKPYLETNADPAYWLAPELCTDPQTRTFLEEFITLVNTDQIEEIGR